MPSKWSLLRSTQIYKITKTPLSYLRLQQVTVAWFLDDLITMVRCFVECERNIKLIVTLLDSLGFVVHLVLMLLLSPKMSDELKEQTSCANTTVQCIWYQKCL